MSSATHFIYDDDVYDADYDEAGDDDDYNHGVSSWDSIIIGNCLWGGDNSDSH